MSKGRVAAAVQVGSAALSALGFVGTVAGAGELAASKWQVLSFFVVFAGSLGWMIWDLWRQNAALRARRRALGIGYCTAWEGCLQETRLIDSAQQRWVTERRFRIGVLNYDDAPVAVRLELVDVQPRTGNVFLGQPLGADVHTVMPSGDCGPPTKTVDLCHEVVADGDISSSIYISYADPALRSASLIRDQYEFTVRASGIGNPVTAKFVIQFDSKTGALRLSPKVLSEDVAVLQRPL